MTALMLEFRICKWLHLGMILDKDVYQCYQIQAFTDLDAWSSINVIQQGTEYRNYFLSLPVADVKLEIVSGSIANIQQSLLSCYEAPCVSVQKFVCNT